MDESKKQQLRELFGENKIEKIEKMMGLCRIKLDISIIIKTFRNCSWNFTNTLNEIREIEEEIIDDLYQISLKYHKRHHECQRLREINEKNKDNRREWDEDDDYGNNKIEIEKFSNGYHLIKYYVDGDSDANKNTYIYIEFCPFCGKELYSEIILDKLTGE